MQLLTSGTLLTAEQEQLEGSYYCEMSMCCKF